jgi:hypothetical protein
MTLEKDYRDSFTRLYSPVKRITKSEMRIYCMYDAALVKKDKKIILYF